MNKYRLSLKLGSLGYLHCIEDDENALTEKVDNLIDLRDSIMSKFAPEGDVIETADCPSIENPSSQEDAILKVLDTDWGRKIPRTQKEIHSALAMNAVHINKGTLCSRLSRLTRINKIGRIKRDGFYAYTIPLRRRISED